MRPGFLAVGLVLAASAQASPKETVPKLLQEIEAKYSSAKTVRADFSEIKDNKLLKRQETSNGTIEIKRPGKVRWETLSPDKSLIVGNSVKYWMYTSPFDEGDPGQVIEKKSSEVQSRFAEALLSGAFSTNRALRIDLVPGAGNEFYLFPLKGTGGTIKKAKISIDPKAKLITGVLLENKDGNTTDFKLSNITLGAALPDARFEFTPPPNTERLKE